MASPWNRNCDNCNCIDALWSPGLSSFLLIARLFRIRPHKSNLSKWISLKVDNPLKRISLARSTFRHNVKYKAWISGCSAQVDAHNQVPVLST